MKTEIISGNKSGRRLLLYISGTSKKWLQWARATEGNLFDQTELPYSDSVYNLARWLAGNDHDAQDVAQEASLRAFKYFGGFRGDKARAWLFSIVRNSPVQGCHLVHWSRQE